MNCLKVAAVKVARLVIDGCIAVLTAITWPFVKLAEKLRDVRP
tara:strand:- start:205 stop:333 length:129 start_codon:yes stop_codon:yes gene_type:complete